MNITLDSANLMDTMVGAQDGCTTADLKQSLEATRAALSGFHQQVDEGKYGFPHLPFDKKMIAAVQEYAKSMAGSYDTVCLVGIGGSALGAWALDCGLRGPHPVQGTFSPAFPRLVILDNVDPMFVEDAIATMQPKKTLVCVIAKSGATAETVAVFLILKAWLEKALPKKASQRVVVVTSEGTGDLKVLATQEGYQTFHLPDNVGGRFSVLSAVGLVPAALIGLDIKKLCQGAAEMTALCWKSDLDENVALKAAQLHYLLMARKGKSIQVAFPYSNRLWGTAFWFRQLWAESLGKAKNRKGEVVNVGQTPVAALGTTDQHSQVQLYMEGPKDKVFTFWAVDKFAKRGAIPKEKIGLEGFDYLRGQSLEKLITAERRATAAALTEQQRPNCTVSIDRVDAANLGAFLQMMEFQTAFMGELMDINAFDQEGVELGKKFTFALMGRKGFEDYTERFAEYERRQFRTLGA
jgi:glucose-6-phosphate isomerase